MADTWEALDPSLSKSTLKSIRNLEFKSMTPVQAAAIPLFMSNKDVAVEAVTGSGKTLAFVIPVVEILLRREEILRKHDVGAIIITPTRELAKQIDEVLRHFTQDLPHLRQLLLIGGTTPGQDVENFKSQGGNILVGTPGRLEDLFLRQNNMDLGAHSRSLEVLVLDEADRLLDMGFELSINTILGFLPKQRRTGLFSATQTEEVEALMRAGLRNPVRVTVREKYNIAKTEQRTPSTLKNFYMVCNADEKFSILVAFLKKNKDDKIMVFFSTCACVNYFGKALASLLPKVSVTSIHGKMGKRHKVFDMFREQRSGVLVCTDVMARGVDIPEVNWVIQYDPPSSSNAFVHRCGRTARIGNQGNALVFLLPTEETYVEFISINQKVPLKNFTMDSLDIRDVLPKLKKMAIKDRDMYDKGMKAFVSFVQAYRKHECNLIFRIKDLDIGKLVSGFGLLKVPKMPELRGQNIKDFITTDVDIEAIPYKDKTREKKRQKRLLEGAVGNGPAIKKIRFLKQSDSWSKKKERRRKQEKRRARREHQKRQQRHVFNEDELEELATEANLLKKLKRGQITKQEFEEKTYSKNEEQYFD